MPPRLPRAQILAILRETPERLGRLTRGVSAATLQRPPAEGEWSPVEVLAHLRSCADVWGDAIEQILTTRHPTIRAVSPRSWIEQTEYRELAFAPSLRAFTRQRARLSERLTPLTARDWTRSATVLGGGKPIERSVHDYAHRLARHERAHWRQVEHALRSIT